MTKSLKRISKRMLAMTMAAFMMVACLPTNLFAVLGGLALAAIIVIIIIRKRRK